MSTQRDNRLNAGIRFSLFATSYSPLFLLIIIRQLSVNTSYLRWGGINERAIKTLLENFSLSLILGVLTTIGFLGIKIFLKEIKISALRNGVGIKIVEVKNKNSEAISYIGTYIIPFLFQSYSTFYEIVSTLILLVVIYFIYINSSLILINPPLNLFYSLYEIGFHDVISDDKSPTKSGMIITSEKYLEENDLMLVKNIGHKLYFGINEGK